MKWIRIESTAANRLLAVLGFIYAIAAVVLASWLFRQTWGGASTLDRLLQLVLAGVALVGVWFVANALHNLGVMPRRSDLRRPIDA